MRVPLVGIQNLHILVQFPAVYPLGVPHSSFHSTLSWLDGFPYHL